MQSETDFRDQLILPVNTLSISKPKGTTINVLQLVDRVYQDWEHAEDLDSDVVRLNRELYDRGVGEPGRKFVTSLYYLVRSLMPWKRLEVEA